MHSPRLPVPHVPFPLSAPAAAALLLALAGCSWNSRLVRSEEFLRTTTQTGMLEAPTGPRATGPQLAPGQVAVQGALEYGMVPEALKTRADGAGGALLATAWVRGQATFGVARWLQLGVALEGSPASLAKPVATDVSTDGWSQPLVRGGMDIRAHFDAGKIGLEPFAEIEASTVRWYHTDRLTETVTMYAPEGGGAGGNDVEVTSRGSTDFNRGAYFSARTGMGLVVGRSGRLQLRAGPYIGNAPWLYGSWSDRWGCDYYVDGDTECSEPSQEPDQVGTILVAGAFANLSLPIGRHIVVNAGGWLDGVPARSKGTTFMARPGGTVSMAFLLGGHADQ